MEKYDFTGWATRNNLKCSDGRIIRQDAFKGNDGQTVPLVWNHRHNESFNVLGHALLKNKPQGVYAYCTFNDTESGKNAKSLVEHGDVTALSIYANQLRQNGSDVMHGSIREVSLVLAGANPGAYIDSVISHGDGSDEEAIIYTGFCLERIGAFYHSEDGEEEIEEKEDNKEEIEELEHADKEEKDNEKMADEKEKTVKDVFDEFTDEQKTIVYALIGQALEDAKSGKSTEKDDEEESEDMKHNVFENDYNEDVLTHAEMKEIIDDGKRFGTLKESALQHGIENIGELFPEPKTLNNPPDWITRDMGWVKDVLNGVHHTPFSRVKSMFADLREEDARARGYIKGKLKKEQVFTLLKRTTDPQTIYKKQKLDRDDVLDITDFDVVAWIKQEMRFMLDEEIARSVLISDGRDPSSDDKINEQHIRPIAYDDDFYAIKVGVDQSGETESERARAFIRAAVKARKDYKGSGSPTLYTTEDVLTDLLLMEDTTGRMIYESEEKLRNVLRVNKIVTVPVMENVKGKHGGDLLGIIVNLRDYNIGADKGGSVNLFDDFDIDYNAQKYLIETRCSGALVKPYSAIVLEAGELGE